MHVSSTEPAALKKLGDVSTLPEQYGVDFLWFDRGWCGVQRKEVKDFIASVRDGRLARELEQMSPLRAKLLALEGAYGIINGMVIPVGAKHPQQQMRVEHWSSALWLLQAAGVMLSHVPDIVETAETVKRFEMWAGKDGHTALGGTRDAVPLNNWGKADDRAYQVHLLSGLPGVGVEMAGRIVDHFSGVPWSWDVTEEQLMEVDGIGKGRAARMMSAVGIRHHPTDDEADEPEEEA